MNDTRFFNSFFPVSLVSFYAACACMLILVHSYGTYTYNIARKCYEDNSVQEIV